MSVNFLFLIPIAYSLVETAEKFGLKRKYAHLLAVPLGILLSFLGLHNITVKESIFYGILVGLGAIGACDTICNSMELIKSKMSK